MRIFDKKERASHFQARSFDLFAQRVQSNRGDYAAAVADVVVVFLDSVLGAVVLLSVFVFGSGEVVLD